MSCDSEIQDELNEMGQLVCDFYYLKFEDKILKQDDPCCENEWRWSEGYCSANPDSTSFTTKDGSMFSPNSRAGGKGKVHVNRVTQTTTSLGVVWVG